MRVPGFSLLCLGLLSQGACARSNVPLGTEDNSAGGNPNNESGADDDAGDDDPNLDSGASNGNDNGASNGKTDSGMNGMPMKDAGQPVMCVAATCASASTDLGELDASNPSAVLMHAGRGSAFLRFKAADTNFGGFAGPSVNSGSVGVGATVTAVGTGKFEVYLRGLLTGAGDACVDNGSDPGSSGATTAIWNGEGLNPTLQPARTLTVEIKQTEGECSDWTLVLEGMPCMIGLPPIPASCR